MQDVQQQPGRCRSEFDFLNPITCSRCGVQLLCCGVRLLARMSKYSTVVTDYLVVVTDYSVIKVKLMLGGFKA